MLLLAGIWEKHNPILKAAAALRLQLIAPLVVPARRFNEPLACRPRLALTLCDFFFQRWPHQTENPRARTSPLRVLD